MDKRILVVGTYDTKDDELTFLADCIRGQGGHVVTMDVSVLGEPANPTDHSKHNVAQAGGSTIQTAIDCGNENTAMQIMARGAAALAAQLHTQGAMDAVIVLGGTMGTDLALDVCVALPVGVPKYVVSTVSFSPMLPPERLAPDIQMILWAGGLYGLNSVCKASLSQAAGAVLGAARAVQPPTCVWSSTGGQPLIGMTSFGKTVLRYMVPLKPALEERGFEVAVFHATGMGGRAFESLAQQNAFACVLDFAPQEVGNHLMRSSISAGPDRMTGAARAGVPQIIAPGCCDLVDFIGWQDLPERFESYECHAHNRLLSSVVLTAADRRDVARTLCAKMAGGAAPTTFILPTQGGNEWDRAGAPLHDGAAMAAFCDEMRRCCPDNVTMIEVDCHINDMAFAQTTLGVIDGWIADGTIRA